MTKKKKIEAVHIYSQICISKVWSLSSVMGLFFFSEILLWPLSDFAHRLPLSPFLLTFNFFYEHAVHRKQTYWSLSSSEAQKNDWKGFADFVSVDACGRTRQLVI